MFNSIIPKLYEMCQNDEFKGIKALQFDDLKIAYEYLNVFEKQHNISTADHNRFETDVLCEFTQTSQQIGFDVSSAIRSSNTVSLSPLPLSIMRSKLSAQLRVSRLKRLRMLLLKA